MVPYVCLSFVVIFIIVNVPFQSRSRKGKENRKKKKLNFEVYRQNVYVQASNESLRLERIY